jgi:hypothetical protein
MLDAHRTPLRAFATRDTGGAIVGNSPPLGAADGSVWSAPAGVASVTAGYCVPSHSIVEGWE